MPKGIHDNHPKGSFCHRWNNGKIISSGGYVKLRVGKGHPLADSNGYAYEHLIIWISAGNSKPPKGYLLHHKNEDKTDNRIQNIECIPRVFHNKHHNLSKPKDVLGRFTHKKAGRVLDGRTRDEWPGDRVQ